MEKVVIIGGGISGLSAAIYTSRANLKPKMISGAAEGGQLMITTDVENFPGFPEGVMGPDLVKKCQDQAKKFGTEFIQKDATSFSVEKDHFVIGMGSEKIKSKSVIISTGASARFLGLESEKKFIGRGVSSCATCDGPFFKDKEVVIVGGGDSACEEGLFLTKFATKVFMIHRRDKLRASKIMAKRVMDNPKIEMVWDSVVSEVLGDKMVSGVKIKNLKTEKVSEIKINGVFIAIGHDPNTKIFKGIIDLDDHGFVKTDRRTKTSVPGIFACGDVQDTIYKQAVTAAGTGCQSALEVEKYLEVLHDK